MLREKFVLTEQGAKNFKKGVAATAVANLVLMAPVGVLYVAANEFVEHLADPAYPLPQIGPFLAAIVVVLAAMYATQMAEYKATYSIVFDESARKRIGIAERLRMLPLSFFGTRDVADLTGVVMKDCADQERLFSHVVPQMFGTGISTTAVAVMLLCFDWRLSVAALWPLPIALAGLLLTARAQKRYAGGKNGAGLAMADGIQEYLECNRELRSFNRIESFRADLDRRIDAFERAKLRSELATGVCVSSAQGFLRLGTASTILAGTLLLVAGQVEFIVFFCFLLVVTRIYDPINIVLQSVAELLDMTLSLDRMRAVESEPVQAGSTEFLPQGHDLVFEHVGFSYRDGVRVLEDVSFTAKEGQVTALVGSSGSGKSTAARLAARFWDADEGRVTLGGVDVASVDPETLLRDYSEVFQDVVLFDDTVMENIRLGRRDASDAEVLAAAAAANCDEFVCTLDAGYDTMVGENGSRLSGGERQRISIARAMLKNAPVVLLDEATASLDVENETKVQAALSRLLAGKTVLVIAHRMRTVERADKIVVLDEGRVVEQGAPRELAALPDGRYRRMRALQQEGAAWAFEA